MKLVTRAQWGARAPRSTKAFNPVNPTTGHWNGPKVPVGEHNKCSAIVRGVQNFHMDSRGWADIAYNWLICPHGYTYEGRGLKYQSGANGTNAGNQTAQAICFMAGEGNEFTDAEKRAFLDTVRYIDTHTTAPSGAIGHRDWKATTCPGDERYRWIKAGMPLPAEKDVEVFESHEARVKFVDKAYQSIAHRTPPEQDRAYWVYVIALNPDHAFDLILDLHKGEHK